jgi:hypothetical protein
MSEYEEYQINPNGDIKEQIEELSPRSGWDAESLYNEINDNLTNVLYMDESGQVFTRRAHGMQYLAKCRI